MPKRNDTPRARRFLPQMSWLIAFDAVARRGSVTEAAEELALTQGAVSRQIQKLEERIGAPLFRRERKRLRLTRAGAEYAAELRPALARIGAATLKLRSNPEGGALELSILPAFGTYWLAPKLPAFLSAHPGVTLNLSTRTRPFDFDTERFHAAIHFGREDWPGTESLRLMEEEVMPVAAPEMMAPVTSPEGLARLPLLHLESRPRAWARWFRAQGVAAEGAPGGMGFDQFATMARAAAFGAGVALLPRFLAEAELAAGRLATLAGTATTSIGAYYLVWPRGGGDYPPLAAFREWISARCAAA